VSGEKALVRIDLSLNGKKTGGNFAGRFKTEIQPNLYGEFWLVCGWISGITEGKKTDRAFSPRWGIRWE